MKSKLTVIAVTLLVSACNSTKISKVEVVEPSHPKNIIMIVGDGMGPAYTSAYRYFNDDPNTSEIEDTVFDRTLVGMSSTYPAKVSGVVTDSAAGATALSAGVKTYNGAIGVDVNKQPVETVLERAKSLGKKTGVVVTSQINHATPASFMAHNVKRSNYNEIADSYVENHAKYDFVLGGGWKFFLREDRNLITEFQDLGFQYIDEYAGLATLQKDKPVIGLFGDVGLPWALDDSDPSRLKTMTKAAIEHIENEQGFFMLIEASQVDWAGHSNDIAAAMGEMQDLAMTLEYLEQYVATHPDTLVVLTADHSTGGFTLGADGQYSWFPEVLKTIQHSPSKIAEKLVDTEITQQYVDELFGFTLTEAELAQLEEAKEPTKEKQQLDSKGNPYADSSANIQKKALYAAAKHIVDKRTITGWTTGAHTAVDVPVFAFGSQSDIFNGLITNTEIANKVFSLLGEK
ncbi:alkaline phosphatase [Paraglaciecola arctica]|uniref:alkaline phosphatase n=1 Tax=Paraglaciecola arctica TaxID=1128911 RepID=UPI001C068AA5|nr:alkaline phosphatase [Paraglaciecola arctica]MBU3003686.1 alkaline phosphatase [Paraglaciecola arctica]